MKIISGDAGNNATHATDINTATNTASQRSNGNISALYIRYAAIQLFLENRKSSAGWWPEYCRTPGDKNRSYWFIPPKPPGAW